MIVQLFQREIRRNWKLWLIISLVMCFYLGVITIMFDPELASVLEDMAQALPNLMRIFGMDLLGTDLLSFLTSYFYGFFAILFPLLFVLLMIMRCLVNYMDRGSLAYLLASPYPRSKIIVTQFLVLIVGLSLMLGLVSLFGIGFASYLFPGDLDLGAFVLLNLACLILQLAVAAISFFLVLVFKDLNQAKFMMIGAVLGMYILHMAANFGKIMENLKYFTLYSLYRPALIIAYEEWWRIVLLAIIALLFYSLAYLVFERRDFHV